MVRLKLHPVVPVVLVVAEILFQAFSFALCICGSRVSHRLVQSLCKILGSFPLSCSVSPLFSGGLCCFGLRFLVRNAVDFSIGFLGPTCCGHSGWRLISCFRLILVCSTQTCFKGLPDSWAVFIKSLRFFFSGCLLLRVFVHCLVL